MSSTGDDTMPVRIPGARSELEHREPKPDLNLLQRVAACLRGLWEHDGNE